MLYIDHKTLKNPSVGRKHPGQARPGHIMLYFLFKYLLSHLALGSRLPFQRALSCDDKSTFGDGLENPGSLAGDDKIANLLLLLFSHEINEINDKVWV